jgi:hypothetical protein
VSTPVTITVERPDETAWQLAQFIKRVDFQTVRGFTEAHAESNVRDARTYLMLEGLGAIARELAERGVAPR